MFQSGTVLLVEDDDTVAELVRFELEEAGWAVAGPFGGVSEAMEAVGRVCADVALLDVSLRGGHAFPVADLLVQRGTPFAFTSGWSDDDLPARFARTPKLRKPYRLAQLMAVLQRLQEAAPHSPASCPVRAAGPGRRREMAELGSTGLPAERIRLFPSGGRRT